MPTRATVDVPLALSHLGRVQGSQGRLPPRGSPFLKDGWEIVAGGGGGRCTPERACGTKEQNLLPLHFSVMHVAILASAFKEQVRPFYCGGKAASLLFLLDKDSLLEEQKYLFLEHLLCFLCG